VGLLLFLAVIPSLNQSNLRALDAQLLRRAELAADQALIALGDLFEGGFVGCDEASIVQIRRTVYRYSLLKDIRVSNSKGAILCSANPEALETNAPYENAGFLTAANRGISLFRVDEIGSTAMGVRWSYEGASSLDAVISTTSLLFDILPQDLRENGTSSLALSDGRPVADPDNSQSVNSKRLHRVSLASKRYPLIATVGVDDDTVAKANREPLLITVMVFSTIGFGFAAFVATLAIHSAGDVARIDAGLSNKEFLPYVQPIYSLTDRRMVGVEVLARWYCADGKPISPDHFIPIAETSGRIVPLTWQLARTALSGLRGHLSLDRQFKIAFNIAPAHLLSDGFIDQFRQIAVNAGVSPRQIVVEITERQEIADVPKASQVLEDLRHRGFRVAFDDVGTGHNGLSYLHKLRADIIKIDKFLIDSIATSRSAKVLVEMLVHVGRELGMTTVAEGIETEEQFALLKACGVDQAQGYLLARPMPIPDLLDLIHSAARGSYPALGHQTNALKRSMIA